MHNKIKISWTFSYILVEIGVQWAYNLEKSNVETILFQLAESTGLHVKRFIV